MNLPNCSGFNSINTTYAVKLVDSNGTDFSFIEDYDVFIACIASASTFCLGHD